MRAGVRLGGGLWVSGGATLVLPLMALRMIELGALALLILVSTVVIWGVAIGFSMWETGPKCSSRTRASSSGLWRRAESRAR